MTFFSLSKKLRNVDNCSSPVIAVFNKDDLLKIIKSSNGLNVSIPLELKTGNGKQKMWFIKKNKN